MLTSTNFGHLMIFLYVKQACRKDTDVVMPEMDGRQLSEQIKKICPNLKVLFMSGYTANVIAHRGVLEEGIQFIAKPFSKNDLARKVREILDNVS